MRLAAIVSPLRTPVGTFGGALRDVPGGPGRPPRARWNARTMSRWPSSSGSQNNEH